MATEQLFRMGAGGTLEAVQPEGRGRGEAMRTFLARGGGLNKSGRYRSGPMKGKTVQEATTMFEDKWATAPGSVKDKYAFRARDILSPSEKRVTGTVATPAMPAPKKSAAPSFDKDANGIPDLVQRPRQSGSDLGFRQVGLTPAMPAGVQLQKESVGANASADEKAQAMASGTKVSVVAPGSDAARQSAAADIAANERFTTADNGAQAMKSAVAMRDNPNAVSSRYPGEAMALAGQRNTLSAGEALSNMASGSMSQAARDAAESARVSADMSVFRANSENRVRQGLPPLDPRSTDDRMRAGSVKTVATPPVPSGGVQSVGSPQASPKTVATPTGGVNRLTGLPFGYRPGDSVAPALQPAANASVAAQTTASRTVSTPVRPPTYLERSQINRPRTVSTGVEGRAADALKSKGQLPSSSPIESASIADLEKLSGRKFFTGRVVPLGGVPAAPSSGYQVGGVGPSGGRITSVRPARR